MPIKIDILYHCNNIMQAKPLQIEIRNKTKNLTKLKTHKISYNFVSDTFH